MGKILNDVRQMLRENIDEKTLADGARVFKEKIKPYGVSVPMTHKIAKEMFSGVKSLPKEEIFALCEELWRSGYLEESFIACDWSYWMKNDFEPADFEVFDRWVNWYVSNWASCDTLCNHTVGEFVERFPAYIGKLKEWARSENRWTKRAGAVSLIIPARKGLFLDDIFEIADILLTDKDDLVQKGYGWMLKATSQAYPKAVFNYVMSKKEVMPRTAFRYAIEKLSPELKARAMGK